MRYYWPLGYWHQPDLHARLRRLTLPTGAPLSLVEVVAHLRLAPGSETGPERGLLEGMLAAAVGHCERYCGIAIMTQDWAMTIRSWPHGCVGLELPNPPLRELLAVRQGDDDLDIADFVLELDDRLPGIMHPVTGFWAWTPSGPGAVEIEFRCGHDAAAAVPDAIKQALLMAIGFWYQQRESTAMYSLSPVVELGWQDLLATYREVGFA